MKVLVSAASRYRSTAEIAQAVGDERWASGVTVTISSPSEVDTIQRVDGVALSSAVYVRHWPEAAIELTDQVHVERQGVPVWLFSSRPAVDPSPKLVQQMGADPVDLENRSATGAREHGCLPESSAATTFGVYGALSSTCSLASAETSETGRPYGCRALDR